MTTVIRTTAHGDVSGAFDLQLRLDGDASIGASCVGVTLEPNYDPDGDPGKDRVSMDFDSAPSEAAIDALLATLPGAPQIPMSLNVAANTWTDWTSFEVAEGSAKAVTISLVGSIGPANDIRALSLAASGTVERSTGSPNASTNGPFNTGPNERLRAKFVISGATVTVQLRCSVAGTITLSSADLEFSP